MLRIIFIARYIATICKMWIDCSELLKNYLNDISDIPFAKPIIMEQMAVFHLYHTPPLYRKN